MSKVGSGCAKPVTGGVVIENFDELGELLAAGLEIGSVPVGCIPGDNPGDGPKGKVLLTIQKGEDGSALPPIVTAVMYADGSVVEPYEGPIADCDAAAPQYAPVQLEELCVLVDGEAQAAVPVVMFDTMTQEPQPPVYLDEMGNLITGEVTAADPCDCGCVSCPPVQACKLMKGFDYLRQDDLSPGDTSEFTVRLDGVDVYNTNIDYLAIGDGINKSTWYTPLQDYINTSVEGWTMTLVTDAAVDTSERVQYRLEYEGNGGSTLQIEGSYNDLRTIVVADDGSMTTTVRDGAGGTIVPDFGSAAWADC